MLSFHYIVRNLWTRRMRTTLTVGGIALVVVASALLMALTRTLAGSLVTTGNPQNLVVLRRGSSTDGMSALPLEAYQAVRFFEGVEKDAQGEPLASAELVVQPSFETRSGETENVLVRGVEPVAFEVHDSVRILEGRRIEPSKGEAIVGRGVASRYPNTAVGSELRFGRNTWKVVGIFESSGSNFESEVWVDARDLAADARVTLPYSGFRLRAAPGVDLEALARRISADTRWSLDAKPETAYYETQGDQVRALYYIVIGIALLAGTGAVFGASNTLYAAVKARRAEIGTLRAIGFSRPAIASAFLGEAVLLALAGFVFGGIGAFALASGVDSALGGITFPLPSFTNAVVSLRIAPADLVAGLVLALAIGLAGGLSPALRASRMRPIEALRRA